MRTIELWSETIPPPADNPLITNTVWSCTFNNDGSQFLVVVGDAIVSYDTQTGQMIGYPLRGGGGHKQNIHCIAYSKDGKRFATGSADNSVIIWKNNMTAELKYQHADSVQCLAFNPLTNQLFSAGNTDFALWTQEVNSIDKQKYNNRILCCSWSPDGQYLAFGTVDGRVSVRNNKLQELHEIKKKSQVWCLDWSPITPENNETILAIGCFDQTISFYDLAGKKIGQSKNVGFDPLCISWFANGEFFLLSGSNKKATLWTRECNFISNICEKKDWIWSVKIKPKQMIVAVTTNDGNISMFQLTSLIVHGLYQDRYAYRDVITDLVVQNMITEYKIRIKCKELVKKISIYQDRLAVQLNDKILIYMSQPDDEMKYKLTKKINKKVDCSLLVVTSNNIILCQEKKLKMLNFQGELEREWILDSLIRYIKVIGGPPKKESLLVGLKNGNVLKIFIENSFPVILIKQTIPIRCVDISPNKLKLAVVDDNSNLSVYDLTTKEMIYSEMNVTSVAWNTDMNDILAYSGNGMLFVKTGNFPTTSQKMNGFVVGFKGSKLFVLHYLNMQTLDVPQTTSLIKYIEKKDFKMAYKLACLGLAEQDFRLLGLESLQGGDFDIAKRCFLRIKELAYIDLCTKYEKEYKNGIIKPIILQSEVLAYQSKFNEAGYLLLKEGYGEKAVELFTELKKWDDAKKFAKLYEEYRKKQGIDNYQNNQTENSGKKQDYEISTLLKDQAEWMKEVGDWKSAADLFVASKEYKKAIELYGQKQDMDSLVELCRIMDKNDNHENIKQCALYFRKNQNHSYAKETYLKLGDMKSLLALHIEFNKWEEAFLIAKQNPEYMNLIKMPYAEFLSKNDRYEDALKVYKKLNRLDLSSKILNQLSMNATQENRFNDAAYYFWTLAIENLSCVKDARNPNPDDQENLRKFYENSDIADIYSAYYYIQSFIESPFQESSGIAYYLNIFNAARFILTKMKNNPPTGVSKVYIYLALAKVGKVLEAFKTTRLCYEKLNSLKIPNEWQDEVELNNLLIRSKPFSDKESLLPICNRCLNPNAILASDDICNTCYHPFIHSSISYETLPLVEFVVEGNISHNEIIDILNSDNDASQNDTQIKKQRQRKNNQESDGWNESADQNVLTIQRQNSQNFSAFDEKMNEICEMQFTQKEYMPVLIDREILKTLKPDEVYFKDLRQFCPTLGIKYYKNMIPEIPLECCYQCNRFFILDEYEFEFLKNKKCPFCKTIDKRVKQNPDLFDE